MRASRDLARPRASCVAEYSSGRPPRAGNDGRRASVSPSEGVPVSGGRVTRCGWEPWQWGGEHSFDEIYQQREEAAERCERDHEGEPVPPGRWATRSVDGAPPPWRIERPCVIARCSRDEGARSSRDRAVRCFALWRDPVETDRLSASFLPRGPWGITCDANRRVLTR